MTVIKTYEMWLGSPCIDELTKEELRAIADLPAEIQDRFYKNLEFGTGGMRGVIGAGTNRINAYTIRRATQGLANYILSFGEETRRKGVVIAHDSRHLSPELSLEAACCLAANDIPVYLFESLRPTPELSFAVRELGATAGIVLTASHNPPEYNGYKVYWEDGAQIAAERADEVIAAIERIDDLGTPRTMTQSAAEEQGLLRWIGREVDDRYMEELRGLVLNPEIAREVGTEMKIVFTPLHGAGNESIQRILREIGMRHVHVVPEQELPDPNFSTVKSPNPEEREAFDLAIRLAGEVGADLIIGTDPDCDRVGVVVRDGAGEFRVLTGNQTGALLMHYILSQLDERGQMPKGATVIKTIVTSEFGRAVAERYNVDMIEVLTGFKYIGEQIRQYETDGSRTFLFGYEESYGYLSGTFVREKDGVMATMQIAEMAAWYRRKGMTLYDALQDLYREFGHYREKLVSRTMKGIEGMQTISRIMESWRAEPPVAFDGVDVVELRDYLQGSWISRRMDDELTLDLPKENVLHYTLADDSWFCLRPSGTEPKIKVYVAVRGETAEEAEAKVERLAKQVLARMDEAQKARTSV